MVSFTCVNSFQGDTEELVIVASETNNQQKKRKWSTNICFAYMKNLAFNKRLYL
jgi:hypothetical protein